MPTKQLTNSGQPGDEQADTLRERNKQKVRKAILDAAREIFLEVGYDKTNMEEIARLSEVGVATVYRSFGTKYDLAIEIVRADLVGMYEEVANVVANPPDDVIEAVIAVLGPPSRQQNTKDWANFVEHMIGKEWNKRKKSGREFARWMKEKLLSQILAVLDDFQGRGLLDQSIDTRATAEMIYSLFDYNYICFSRNEISSIEEMRELTASQVRFLLSKCVVPG